MPINPLLKPEQVAYILRDCNVRVLVTSPERLALLAPVLAELPRPAPRRADRRSGAPSALPAGVERCTLGRAAGRAATAPGHRVIDTDMAAILYTSGSTGKPKGVVLSHRNMVAGAKSVASYLENHADDTLLAALPLSFDAGFSQLTTAFHAGARVVLLNYLLPRDVLKAHGARARHRPHRRAAAVDPARAAGVAGGDQRAPALFRQHRRPHAARDADAAAPARCRRPSRS